MLHKRSAIKAPGGRDEGIEVRCAHDEGIKIEIPESLKKKRLEELIRKNLEEILVK